MAANSIPLSFLSIRLDLGGYDGAQKVPSTVLRSEVVILLV